MPEIHALVRGRGRMEQKPSNPLQLCLQGVGLSELTTWWTVCCDISPPRVGLVSWCSIAWPMEWETEASRFSPVRKLPSKLIGGRLDEMDQNKGVWIQKQRSLKTLLQDTFTLLMGWPGDLICLHLVLSLSHLEGSNKGAHLLSTFDWRAFQSPLPPGQTSRWLFWKHGTFESTMEWEIAELTYIKKFQAIWEGFNKHNGLYQLLIDKILAVCLISNL